MSIVQPSKALHKIAETNNQLVIQTPFVVMPKGTHGLFRVFGWLCILVAVGLIIIDVGESVLDHHHLMPLSAVTLLFVAMFGGSGLYLVLAERYFRLSSREISVIADRISIGRRTNRKLQGEKTYLASHIANLRIGNSPSVHGILFDYGGETVGFGAGLNLSAGEEIVSAILAKFPHYGKSALPH